MNIAQKRLVAAIVAMHPELCMGDKKQEELYLAMHDLTSKMAKLNKCGGECLNEDSGLHLQDVSVKCEHPFAYVHTRCMGEINHCLKCGKDL